MLRLSAFFLYCFIAASGATYTLTLKQALTKALEQNPDVSLARLDELKSVQAVRQARDPFYPRVTVGSGLAYSSGFPLSIEGAAPSVFQAHASQYIFNRQQSYAIQQARENARATLFASASKQDEIAYRTASLFLDANRGGRLTQAAGRQVENLKKVVQTVGSRIQEGRELPIELKRSNLELAKAIQRSEALTDDEDYAERSLAVVLGYAAGDRVLVADEDRGAPSIPNNEQEAIAQALAGNPELKRLQSSMLAKGLEVKSQKAARLPRLDLVGEYALLARYNNYDEFFKAFQRNNVQLGMSLQIPVVTGPGISAAVAQAELDGAHLRIEAEAVKNRIALDIHQSYQEIHRAETARAVSQADLEVTRDSLTIVLAQMGEGRASLRQVEEARFLENEKWIAFYDAQFSAEKARLNLLRQTGDLVASVK